MPSDSSVPSLFIYYHTHWDREWYQPFCEYQVRLADVVDDILDRLESGVLPCFTLDGQTALLADYLELRPHNEPRLRALILSGKISVGPWYVLADEFLVSGESLIRNLQRGIKESKAWGCQSFTGYLPDTFGHSSDMPTLLKGVGIDTAVLWRGVNPKSSLFTWQGRNGDTVDAYHLKAGYFQNMFHDPQLTDTERKAAFGSLLESLASASEAGLMLVPIGGDHLGSLPAESKRLLDSCLSAQNVMEGHPVDFFKQIATEAQGYKGNKALVLGELTDNSSPYGYVLQGVFSSRMYLKQANRRLEHRLIHQLEPLTAMVQGLLPENALIHYPKAELEKAWQLLLLNHPHDSICGCSVDEVHRENEVRFESAEQFTRAVMRRQIAGLNQVWKTEKKTDTKENEAWVVLNTGSTAYRGVVSVTSSSKEKDSRDTTFGITELLSTVDDVLYDNYLLDTQDVPMADRLMTESRGLIWVDGLPAHSVTLISKSNQIVPAGESVTIKLLGEGSKQAVLESSLFKVNVAVGEGVTVLDKRTGKTFKDLFSLTDMQDNGDSYNSAPDVREDTGSGVVKGELIQVWIRDEGPLRASIGFFHEMPEMTMPIEGRITLEAGGESLLFGTSFTNETMAHRVQAVFKTGAPVESVEAESHLGVITREYNPNAPIQPVELVGKGREFKPNTGPVQRFVMANQQLFMTKGLTEYEVSGTELRLTLLRTFSFLSKEDTGVRGGHAGPPLLVPDGECLGRAVICRYSWSPIPVKLSGKRDASWVQWAYRQSERFYGVVSATESLNSSEDVASVLSKQLISWDNSALLRLSLKCLDVSKGAEGAVTFPERCSIVLRLSNVSNATQSAQFSCGFPVARVVEMNLLEEPLETASGEGVCEVSLQDALSFEAGEVKTLCFYVK